MSSITRDLIEYSYDNACYPLESYAFKQINVDTVGAIPDCKPAIEQVLKVSASVKVLYHKIIKTPKGKSIEGNVLTGKKVIVEGVIEQKVQYVACEEVQSVHVVSFSTPFISYVVLPDNINCCGGIVVSAFIEDMIAKPDTCRQFYMNNTILIVVER
ncbi:MAG: SPOCS domain-containing protein [Cellulosilyticaceae bacterium]